MSTKRCLNAAAEPAYCRVEGLPAYDRRLRHAKWSSRAVQLTDRPPPNPELRAGLSGTLLEGTGWRPRVSMFCLALTNIAYNHRPHKIRTDATTLGSANLGPLVFLVFFYNFLKSGPQKNCATNSCTWIFCSVTVGHSELHHLTGLKAGYFKRSVAESRILYWLFGPKKTIFLE